MVDRLHPHTAGGLITKPSWRSDLSILFPAPSPIKACLRVFGAAGAPARASARGLRRACSRKRSAGSSGSRSVWGSGSRSISRSRSSRRSGPASYVSFFFSLRQPIAAGSTRNAGPCSGCRPGSPWARSCWASPWRRSAHSSWPRRPWSGAAPTSSRRRSCWSRIGSAASGSRSGSRSSTASNPERSRRRCG
jgi:hypothetical protein